MTASTLLRRTLSIAACAVFTAGCTFQGINSLALPGAQGRGRGASLYHVETANVGTLESNSPVLMADVVVGSVGRMRIKARHADVDVWVKPGVVVPENAVATIGQTSLLGSMHVALNPPPGQAPHGHLRSGVTIPLGPHIDISLHRTDPVLAVRRHQLRRPGPDRRRRSQLQHRTVRPRKLNSANYSLASTNSSACSISSAAKSLRRSNL